MKSIQGINCITGKIEKIAIQKEILNGDDANEESSNQLPYIGPGLMDLQINGIDGIDFNNNSLTREDILAATKYLLTNGITTFFPTIITNSDESVTKILGTLANACEVYPLVNACVEGIHLEGPFISPEEGARGAHQKDYIKPPDWVLVQKFQEVAKGKIKVITLAPEWEAAPDFIRICTQADIKVALGHTSATPAQIQKAIQAGASMSTHLGNGVPLTLPRHPNILWEQLAQDELYASIIADGFHIPESFIKVVLKTKGSKAMLVSDATRFSGMEPNIYDTHIGGKVVLEKNGRLAIYQTPGMLAGATKNLLENVQYLIDKKIADLDKAWEMASVIPQTFIKEKQIPFSDQKAEDWVVFNLLEQNKIQIIKVFKDGKLVFEIS